MKQLGDRLRDLRESRNLKQTDVAKALRISNKILSSYERNISMPTIENIKNLCEYYNVSADYLLQIEIQKEDTISDTTTTLVEITPAQKKLLSYYERLNTENKEAIRGLMILYYKEQLRKKQEKNYYTATF
jgi:transcriptional regulator with XRE-family HTH domain